MPLGQGTPGGNAMTMLLLLGYFGFAVFVGQVLALGNRPVVP